VQELLFVNIDAINYGLNSNKLNNE